MYYEEKLDDHTLCLQWSINHCYRSYHNKVFTRSQQEQWEHKGLYDLSHIGDLCGVKYIMKKCDGLYILFPRSDISILIHGIRHLHIVKYVVNKYTIDLQDALLYAVGWSDDLNIVKCLLDECNRLHVLPYWLLNETPQKNERMNLVYDYLIRKDRLYETKKGVVFSKDAFNDNL